MRTCGHDGVVLAQIHSLSAVAGGCLEAVPALAAAPLRRHVLGYSGFRATEEGARLRRILPLNLTTLIIDWTGVPPLLTGPRETGLRYAETGWRNGIAIGLTPVGVRALLGVRQSELTGRIGPLDELLGSGAAGRAAGGAARLATTIHRPGPLGRRPSRGQP